MPKCTNQACGATFSCGCQRRIASDGKQCCTSCLVNYEKQVQAKKNQGNLPKVNNVVWTNNK